MKNYVVNKCINLLRNNGDYDEIKLAEIKYGLEGIYMLISKLIVIIILSILLGIIKEVLIFLLIYNFIRMPSFGLHATKSWICLLSSSIIFIGVPYLAKSVTIPICLKIIAGIILILLFFKNAPADTYKRPIVSQKRRNVYKFLSTLVAIIYVFASLFINNTFISNSFILSLVVQSCMISPLVYKIFNLPYDNYKTYLANQV